MKFRVKRGKKAIKVRNNFAKIEGIDDDGLFIYSVDYYANISNAIFKDAVTVRVTAYPNNPNAGYSMLSGVRNSADMVRNVLSMRADQSNAIVRSQSRALASTNLDLSARISNQTASKLRKSTGELLPVKKVLRAVPKSQIESGRAKSGPMLAVSKQDKNFTFQNQSMKLSALEAVLKDGVDPSSLGGRKFPLVTTKNSIQGTHGWSKKASRAVGIAEKNPAVRSILNNFQLGGRFTTQEVKDPPRDGSSTTQTIAFNERIEWKFYENFMSIPDPSRFGSAMLYFVFELIDKHGAIVNQIVRVADHGLLLDSYYTPRDPPLIAGARAKALGTNVLNIKQVDPIAVSVDLYKKTINPAMPQIDLRYKFVSNILCTSDSGEVKFRDTSNNSLTAVYRAIPVGPGRRASGRFSNYVARAIKAPGRPCLPSKELEHVSIFATNMATRDAVLINVTNIPDGPISVYVTARDLSVGQRSTRVVGDLPEDKIKAAGSALIFTDTDVKHAHRYLYNCVMVYRHGREVSSKNPVAHEFIKSFKQEKFKIFNSTPVLESISGSVAATFNLGADFTDRGLNDVADSLKAAGIETKFDGELVDNREKYQALLGFEVLRENNTTGETESFGVVSANIKFIDGPKSRKKSGVKSLMPGRTYRYVFNLCARDPGTFFTQTKQDKKDPSSLSSYKENVFKYMNPFTLSSGILPSTQESLGLSSVSSIKPQDPLLQGKTGLSRSATIGIPISTARVVDLRAVKIDDDENILTWRLEGTLSAVDHFIVLAELEGVKSTLGTVHTQSESKSFTFFDNELAPAIGTTTYSVVPVFDDYSYGAESEGVSVTNQSEIPSFASNSTANTFTKGGL